MPTPTHWRSSRCFVAGTSRFFASNVPSPQDCSESVLNERFVDAHLGGEVRQFAYGCLKFLEISCILSNGPSLIRHTFRRTRALTIVPKGESLMQFALLIYESPEAFAARRSDGTDPYTGAWRASHTALF